MKITFEGDAPKEKKLSLVKIIDANPKKYFDARGLKAKYDSQSKRDPHIRKVKFDDEYYRVRGFCQDNKYAICVPSDNPENENFTYTKIKEFDIKQNEICAGIYSLFGGGFWSAKTIEELIKKLKEAAEAHRKSAEREINASKKLDELAERIK